MTHAFELHAEWDGPAPEGRPALVLVHGFTGSAASWEPVRADLRRWGSTLALDLLGHGASPAPDETELYRIEACLDRLERVLSRLNIPRGVWVGYSMGARVALAMAVLRPGRVAGLILESATAGIADPHERARRAAADEALAAAIMSDGVAAFVERWLAQPLFEGLRRLPPELLAQQRAQRLHNDPHGLAHTLRGLGSGVTPALWERLGGIAVPTLLIAGAQDEKYAHLGRMLHAAIRGSELCIVPNSGHVPHVERPADYLRAVAAFLARHTPC